MASEPHLVFQTLITLVVPYLAYFIGIVIRKKALPSAGSPPLLRQIYLGIPISLVIVSPTLVVIRNALTDIGAYLFTVGIIMEHGMLVQETATKHIKNLLEGRDTKRISPEPGEALGSADTQI